MVTRSVIRISPEEKAALDAKARKHKKDPLQTNNIDKNEDEQKSFNEKSNNLSLQNRRECDRLHLELHSSLPPHGAEVVQGRSMEITQQDNDTNKKRRRDAQNGGERDKKKHKSLDLSDVPEQPPIRSKRKGGSSQFRGVTFSKATKKWQASIIIDGKLRFIGYHDNEEEAAIDYARALFKYKKGNAEDNIRQRKKLIDLTGVPTQLPIKSVRKGSKSQYKGINFHKASKKWVASISIDGKNNNIGSYDNEEEAAVDYARAVFKYKGANMEHNSRQNKLIIDLTDVPKQLPIKCGKRGSSSQYRGVTFNKARKKWQARIWFGKKMHSIGYYSDEEEAGIDYARAVFKLKYRAVGEDNDCQSKKSIDLTHVPQQLPIKSERKGSCSQYKGVTFHKKQKKWLAGIWIDGKQRYIGCYDNEEEAAVGYARAVVKYKGSNTEHSSRQNKLIIDLSDVPKQLPIKSKRKGTSSQYKGVSFDKSINKWKARIWFGGKKHTIGSYDNEEEAGIDYARALFKYKGSNTEDSCR